jgi:hypothetical protein
VGVPIVVVGEWVRVCLEVENPFHVALPIEFISLISHGVAPSVQGDVDAAPGRERAERGGGEGVGGGGAGRGGGGKGGGQGTAGAAHSRLRLIPTCVQLPPRSSAHARTHPRTWPVHGNAVRAAQPSTQALAGEEIRYLEEGVYRVFLDAIVMPPTSEGDDCTLPGSAHEHLGSLKGCKIRLWNVIYEIASYDVRTSTRLSKVPPPRQPRHALGVPGMQRHGGRGGRGRGVAGVSSVELTPLYKTLRPLPLLRVCCTPRLPAVVVEGQVLRATLTLENMGSQTVNVLRLVPGWPDNTVVYPMLVYNQDDVASAQFLPPGARTEIRLCLLPRLPTTPAGGWEKSERGGGVGKEGGEEGGAWQVVKMGLAVEYAEGEEDAYWRTSEWFVTMRVLPGLCVRSMCVVAGDCLSVSRGGEREREGGGGGGGGAKEGGDNVGGGGGGAVVDEILPGFVTNENYAYAMPAEGVSMVCLEEPWAEAEESVVHLEIRNGTVYPFKLWCALDIDPDFSRRHTKGIMGGRRIGGEGDRGEGGDGGEGSGWGGGRCVAVVEGKSSVEVRVKIRRFQLACGDAEEEVARDWLPAVGQRAMSYPERKAAAERAYLARYARELISRLSLHWTAVAPEAWTSMPGGGGGGGGWGGRGGGGVAWGVGGGGGCVLGAGVAG